VTYEPLHHKYRPQSFAELVGQEAVTTTLSNALRQQKIAPAYLFTGARGTGKTSSARILAKSLNCIKGDAPTDHPCGICEICQSITKGAALDVIEIDAASNTGVDNIRDLIERAQFAPVQCRYKVYVIDEVHMLSNAAFNALLKTLEEPPSRIVFILATTDPQKVLPTIISRCQRFDFRRIPLAAMTAHLSKIAHLEAIAIMPEAIQLVAQIAQGGLRDAESLLDQLSLLDGEITVERVWDLVGAVPERDLLALLRAIAQNQPALVLEHIRHLLDRGREPLVLLQNLASFYRDLLIAKTAPDRHDLVAITPPTWADLCEFAQAVDIAWITAGQQCLRTAEHQVKQTTQPRLWLEVNLLGLLPAAVALAPVRQLGASAMPAPHSPSTPIQPLAQTSVSRLSPEVDRSSTEPHPLADRRDAEARSPVPAQDAASNRTTNRATNRATASTDRNLAEQPSASSEPAPSASPPPVATADVPVSLQQLWQQVLALVQPPSTQMMMRQQCHLIDFNGDRARIGTKTENLFNMAKARLSSIEVAFSKRLGKPIKVSLEIAAMTVTPTATIATTIVAPQPASDLSSDTASGQAIAPPPIPPAQTHSPPAPPPVSNPSEAIEPPAASEPPIVSEPPAAYQQEDEVTRAARNFAQMFNGQLVNEDTDVDEENIDLISGRDSTSLGPTDIEATDVASTEDEDDVPF
jgi:DNA polymerase-3 subunit gamma/tau